LPLCIEKMVAIAEIILGVQPKGSAEAAALQGIERLEAFFADLKISTRLKDIVSDPDVLPQVCEMAANDACLVTNPREATVADMIEICKASW
jgi:alcohol dehydrogenase